MKESRVVLRLRSIVALLAASLACHAPARAQEFAGRTLGSPDSFFGCVLALVGDLDGDGISEFAVTSFPAAADSGRVELVSGLTGATLRKHDATLQGMDFGASIAGGFDLDGDAVADYVIGCTETGTSANRGRAIAFSGATGTTIWTWTSSIANARAGSSVALIPDLDADGRCETLVGAPGSNRAVVIDETGALLLTLTEPQGSTFGDAVARLGDVDGDGVDDFVVSDPTAGPLSKTGCGRIHAYSGRTTARLWSHDGPNSSDFCGQALAAVGDVNGDGSADVLAGSGWGHVGVYQHGFVEVVNGGDGAVIRTTYGDQPYEYFGGGYADVGDWDGDGVADYAVGAIDAWVNATRSEAGVVRVYSGASGVILHEFRPPAPASERPDSFGARLLATDLDFDGTRDLLISDFSLTLLPRKGSGGVEVGALFGWFTRPTLFNHGSKDPEWR